MDIRVQRSVSLCRSLLKAKLKETAADILQNTRRQVRLLSLPDHESDQAQLSFLLRGDRLAASSSSFMGLRQTESHPRLGCCLSRKFKSINSQNTHPTCVRYHSSVLCFVIRLTFSRYQFLVRMLFEGSGGESQGIQNVTNAIPK